MFDDKEWAEKRIRELEDEGLTHSDAIGAVMVEEAKKDDQQRNEEI